MTTNRITWADSAKALGIFLVFWGHLLEAPGYGGNDLLLQVYRHIYSFHMPFFFLLAGFFFRDRQQTFISLFFEKIRTRLIPVLFFVAMALFFWLNAAPLGLHHIDSEGMMQKQWLLFQGKPVANWPAWFLVCLFTVELIAAGILPLLSRRWLLWLSLPLIYLIARMATNNVGYVASVMGVVENWWFLQEALMGLFFYAVGYCLASGKRWLLPSGSLFRSVIMLAVTITLLAVATHLNFEGGRAAVNMSASAHGHSFWFPVGAISGSLMFIHLSSLLPANRLLNFIGQNTLPLIGFCGLFLSFFNVLLWNIFPVTGEVSSLLISIPLSVGSLLVCLPVVFVLRRFVPFLIGVK